MTYPNATQMANQFSKIGGFSSVTLEHDGYSDYSPADAFHDSAEWNIRLRFSNPRTGNNANTWIADFTAKAGEIKALARNAKAKATAMDLITLARMRAERSCNAE